MSKYVIDSSTLTSIADAVRAKTGSTSTIKVSDIPTEISKISGGGGGDLPAEALNISGNCQYKFANGGWDWFIEKYRDKIVTQDIINASYMFYNSNILKIPFDINCSTTKINVDTKFLFSGCENLLEVPKINNLIVYSTERLFETCHRLRNIPENIADTWNWSYLEKQTATYTGNQSRMFDSCFSLRSIPMNIFKSGNHYNNYSNSYFYYGFGNCYTLDQLENLPIPYTKATWTSNAFYNTFASCRRLKDIIFNTNDDGTPIVVTWKSQTIDLTTYTGYSKNNSDILKYNSGITADKEVKDDATYQALKNDPDWFTCNVAYSRYNHDSAVRTINSLPDTSAYLASAGGTNTIKFKGAAGSATDGGAINTLTSEEIAVATAKGWTVSFA